MMAPVKRTELEILSIDGILGLKLVKQKVFPDDRGYFVESYNQKELESLGFLEYFKQDNYSYSKCGVLRGLHSQPHMGKLVTVITGRIFDVAVDIRPGSQTFGQWHGEFLSEDTRTCFWIPDGFLHGFYVLSEKGAHVLYKCTAIYDSSSEFGVNPFDPELNIDWHIVDRKQLKISDRDRSHKNLNCLHLDSNV